LNKREMSLSRLAESVVENLQITASRHQIILEKSVKEILVIADEARIEQVLVNLINNAIKYSAHANEVIVKISKKIQDIEVSIQDFGVGMKAIDTPHIFDRFYRVSEHQNKISGLGIGLNVSKEIIQLHEGEIWVESTLGKGSIFYFSIPISEKTDEKDTTL